MHAYSTNGDRLRIYIGIGLLSALLTPVANNLISHLEFLASLEPWISSGPSFGVVYAMLFGLYNRVVWKWSWLGWFGLPITANLQGKYTGKLISSFKDEAGKNVEVKLSIEIEQTWTKLLVYLQTGTDTSESFSYMASLCEVDGKSSRLTYTYTNKPFSAIADPDMQPHDGTASLVFRKDNSVKGTYFNARTRTGTITLTRKRANSSGSVAV